MPWFINSWRIWIRLLSRWAAKPVFFVNGYEQYTWDKLMSTNLGGKQRLDLYSEAIAKLSLIPILPQLFRDISRMPFCLTRPRNTQYVPQGNQLVHLRSQRGFGWRLWIFALGDEFAGRCRAVPYPAPHYRFYCGRVDPKKTKLFSTACAPPVFWFPLINISGGRNAEKTAINLPPMRNRNFWWIILSVMIFPRICAFVPGQYGICTAFPNPTFMSTIPWPTRNRWDDSFDVYHGQSAVSVPEGRHPSHKRFSIQANRSEVLFVDYIAEHLILTAGRVTCRKALFFSVRNAYKSCVKCCLDNYLYCVVSLPAGVFNPYSGAKTSICLWIKPSPSRLIKYYSWKSGMTVLTWARSAAKSRAAIFPQHWLI